MRQLFFFWPFQYEGNRQSYLVSRGTGERDGALKLSQNNIQTSFYERVRSRSRLLGRCGGSGD